MLSIFDFDNYHAYMSKRIKLMPNQGNGLGRKLAEHMGIHTSLVSQILQGQRELNPDYAASMADFFGMNDLETDYFLALVHLEKAGNEIMRKAARRQVNALKKKAADLAQTTPYPKILTEEQIAIFYSSWMYSAIMQLSGV